MADQADGAAAALRLLDMTRGLRARERDHLAGVLHDGPIQELGAAALELALARRALPASDGAELDVADQQLEAAGRLLRRLVDELSRSPRAAIGLAEALRQRTGWLLAAPLAVDLGEGTSELPAAEIETVADLAELMLLGAVGSAGPGAGPAAGPVRALAAVRADDDRILLELNLTSAAGDQPFGDQAAVGAWLDGLAAATRMGAAAELRGRRLRAWMEIPRSAAGAR
jgi:Histidine kinase